MSVRNPFLCPVLGPSVEAIDVASRIEIVKELDAEECHAALKVPGLQKIVRQAVERRLRRLAKEQRA